MTQITESLQTTSIKLFANFRTSIIHYPVKSTTNIMHKLTAKSTVNYPLIFDNLKNHYEGSIPFEGEIISTDNTRESCENHT